MSVFRVQDVEGRGPFRLGLTCVWMTPVPMPERDALPSWFVEFGLDVLDQVRDGEHVASAVATVEAIGRWFMPDEQLLLRDLGFRLMAFEDARVLAESSRQMVIARREPFTTGGTPHEFPALVFEAAGK